MVEAMNSVAKLGVELNAEERNLLSVGYKNMLKRASWSDTQHAAALAKEYLERVEDELTTKCNEILLTIDDYLLPSSKTGEAAVFYHKMKGDYYRYSAEIKSDADREEAKSQSLKAYEDATAIAQSDLFPTHPISLGLALNFSMFYYEIMADTERACNMAKQAFEDAAAELDSLDENSYQDSSLIMRLIMDNLTLWTADPSEDEDMVEAMNSVAKLGVELNAEERNLLSVGYKNMLKRASWSDTQHAAALAKEYLERVEDELTTKCNEILLTIDDTLIIRLMGDKSNAEASDTKREKGDKHQVSGFLKLPDDSIYALMGRLEVTDIVRLGGVSKYLSKFGKEYIKSRLRTNIFLPSSQFHSLSITEDHSWMCHDIQRVSNTPRDPAVFPYRSFPENLIVGSIEGTLLIVELKLAPHTLLLVNPLTKHQIVIPPRPAQPHPLLLIEDDAVINMFAYGLGWARKPSEIAVYQLFRMFSIGMEPCCALYSVKEGYWIKFPPLDGSIEITQYAGTLHMGTNSLYWLAKDDRTREVVILKLNMEQLLFSTLPFSTEARGVPVDCLGIVNGNLSALTREYMESDSVPCSEVWALEEGGESRRNWSRIYTIPHHQLFNSRRSYFPTILTFTDGGLVFLLNLEKTDSKEEEQKRYITVYNLPDNSLQELSSPTTMRYVSATQASVYTESTRFPDHIRNTMKSDEEQTAAEEVLKDLNKPPMYVVEMTGLGADDW